MKTIHLHGYLREKYGESFKFDVESPAMAVSALRNQLPGFSEAVSGGKFVLVRGDLEKGYSIDADELPLKFGRTRNFHIIPYVEGSGGKAGMIVKIVLGVALLATGIGGAFMFAGAAVGGFAGALAGFGVWLGPFSISFGSMAVLGLALTATGVSGMLTPRQDLSGQSYENRGPADERQSFLFNGARNTSQQGVPIPLVYGRMRVGSVIISAGITTEEVG